jgi:hypothetical protein
MIHIASTYVADVLNDYLKLILQPFCEEDIAFHYNQIFQQALLPNSAFNENQQGLNVMLIRIADLFNPTKAMHQNPDDLKAAIDCLQKSTQVPLLIIVTPSQALTSKKKIII